MHYKDYLDTLSTVSQCLLVDISEGIRIFKEFLDRYNTEEPNENQTDAYNAFHCLLFYIQGVELQNVHNLDDDFGHIWNQLQYDSLEWVYELVPEPKNGEEQSNLEDEVADLISKVLLFIYNDIIFKCGLVYQTERKEERRLFFEIIDEAQQLAVITARAMKPGVDFSEIEIDLPNEITRAKDHV